MPATPTELFDRLKNLGIETTTIEHPAVFTTDEAATHCAHLPGAHCKSLFLKDRKGALWLVVTLDHRRLDMKALQELLGAARLSFGKPDLMTEILGVSPGSVTPFALINDTGQQVTVALDREMMAAEVANYHPLTNTMTTSITLADLRTFITACGHIPREVDLSAMSAQID